MQHRPCSAYVIHYCTRCDHGCSCLSPIDLNGSVPHLRLQVFVGYILCFSLEHPNTCSCGRCSLCWLHCHSSAQGYIRPCLVYSSVILHCVIKDELQRPIVAIVSSSPGCNRNNNNNRCSVLVALKYVHRYVWFYSDVDIFYCVKWLYNCVKQYLVKLCD